jgi:dTDP-L-rhamnose 4-epimerase
LTTILITGGAGFIGSRLARRLIDAGHHVRVLDPLTAQVHGEVPQGVEWLQGGSVEFIRGSVTSRADWVRALANVECVVHLAAETGTGQSMYEISRYNEVNSQGTALLFDVLAAPGPRSVQRVILASSRSIYGEGRYGCKSCGLEPVYPPSRSGEQLQAHRWEPACPRCGADLMAQPTREGDSPRPASIYAATKYAQEELVRIGCESLGLGYTIFRLQNVFGEGQSLKNPYTGILSIFSTRIRRGLELPLFEDGKETRDFVHVDDVVTALTSAVEVPTALNGIFNVGSGVATSIAEVATMLTRALGATPNTIVTGQYRIGDIRHNVADMSHIGKSLGFVPQIDLATGLARFARWVESQPLPEDLLGRANSELQARALMGQ